jgi:excinuclease ABC subunit C
MKNINRLGKLLDGKKQELTKDLIKEMALASKEQNFEEAQRIKKIITGISYLTQPNKIKSYLENPNFLEDQRQLALLELQRVLNLPKLPERIEGYDISNIQGHESVGSMVVLTNGEIDKSQYRKFKIKITGKPNDYAMHQEMMGRRLKHPEWPYPDLIIIDGGLGQVHSVFPIIHDTNPLLPVFGLAKRMEWLYSPDGSIIKLPKSSPALKLVQKLRDESHRFAITFHRKLRDQALLSQSKVV